MSQDLIQKGALSLLQFSADEWDDLQNTRNGVSRFSLTFEHDSARSGKKNSLVLITVAGSQFPDPEFDIKDSRQLFIGVVNSIATVAMFSSRVVFTSVEKIAPGSLEALLDRVTDSNLRGAITSLRRWDDKYRAVSPKPASSLIQAIAAIPENRPALQRMLARMDVPRRFENGRALQQDAVRTALKVFGAGPEADAVTLGDDDTALGRVRLREDMVVAYDAMSAPGWTLSSRYQTGRATFTQDEEQLDIITVNKQPLEEIFGVDLIYLNQTHRALVMLQYKMMEPAKRGSFARFGIDDAESDEREWLVWIDSQTASSKAELERMVQFDKDLSPEGNFRLHSGAFYFKLVKRYAATNAAGIILSLDHLKKLIANDALRGPRGGLRISYDALCGHYLRGEAFVELIRSGYIGRGTPRRTTWKR